MLTLKATKLAILCAAVLHWRIRIALGTHSVFISSEAVSLKNLQHLILAYWALDTSVALHHWYQPSPGKRESQRACTTIQQLLWKRISIVVAIVRGLLKRHESVAGAAFTKVYLQYGRVVVGRSQSRKVSRHSLVELAYFCIGPVETLLHLLQDWLHDLVFCLAAQGNVVAFSFHLTTQIWLVELISHAVVPLDESDPQLCRMKLERRILGCIFSVENGGNVRCNRRVSTNTIPVH